MTPCNVCKGKFNCMFCGFKREKKQKLSEAEIRARDARRERIMMLDQFSKNSMLHGNYSTGLDSTNLNIEEHRAFIKEVAEDVERYSISHACKVFELTVSQVKRLLASGLHQELNRFPDHTFKEPDLPKKSKEEIEREISEARRKRDEPKPPRRGVLADLVEGDDDDTYENYYG